MVEEKLIGTLNEKPLHAALKAWYAEPGDDVEEPVGDYVIDIVRDDLLIEVQTAGLHAIRGKLRALAAEHTVRLVLPLAQDKWLVKLAGKGGGPAERRKSPKHCTLMHVFEELIRLPALLGNPRFSLEVLLIREEEVRRRESGRAWRRKGWVVHERRLLDVLERHLFENPRDMARLLPESLPEQFTTADLSSRASVRRSLAQKACYCLRKMGAIEQVGKCGNAYVYRRAG